MYLFWNVIWFQTFIILNVLCKYTFTQIALHIPTFAIWNEVSCYIKISLFYKINGSLNCHLGAFFWVNRQHTQTLLFASMLSRKSVDRFLWTQQDRFSLKKQLHYLLSNDWRNRNKQKKLWKVPASFTHYDILYYINLEINVLLFFYKYKFHITDGVNCTL